MAGFFIGAISDLCHTESISNLPSHSPTPRKPRKKVWPVLPITMEVSSLCNPAMGVLHWLQVELSSNVKRTDGIAACPLNRLLTRLSIPFGFLHAASTHLYVSLWWRLKRFVPNILRKLSKILSSQATQNLTEGDRSRCE